MQNEIMDEERNEVEENLVQRETCIFSEESPLFPRQEVSRGR